MFSSNGTLESWIEGKSTQKRFNEHCIEYKPSSDDTSAITSCFLETSSEPFVIRLKRSETLFPGDDFRAICEVDGKDIGFSIWRADRLEYDWKAVWERRDGQLYESSLTFDTLATTDDPSEVNISVRDLENIGTIVITLTRGTTKISRKGKGIELFNKVRGKAMENRGFLTSVTTIESEAEEEWQPVFYDFTPSGSGIPYHRFVFKYRPAGVLKYLGKIESDKGDNLKSGSRFYPYQMAKTPLPLPFSSDGETLSEGDRSGSESTRATNSVGPDSTSDKSKQETSGALVRLSSTYPSTGPKDAQSKACRYSFRPGRKRTFINEEEI
ncbi:hypothetical protein L486_03899 [Kwoniella mangroviensis CBS 10435]|uniref:DUF7918 domain-containing protein n=1 Tax=Kwoniella mangroviensis CBS 10435 TaxID=1331196 RepID=A0A1B9IQQ9_9TREE|nr:hypothetical protein L486_03899 [Kwoniella mangroviensis CBS 10435]